MTSTTGNGNTVTTFERTTFEVTTFECRKLKDQYRMLEFNIWHSCDKNLVGEKGKCCLPSTH